ncbi:MAG: transposase [Cyanothece sp. SIO1E1]|nr:transposase [Cyanothece sp. SIO1E1]
MQPKFKGKYRIESARLPHRNYAANGRYFVTICTYNRRYFLGDVSKKQVQLSEIGVTAQRYWAGIPDHFDDVAIDAYVVMPNHVHGIVVIDRPVGFSSVVGDSGETLRCNVSTTRRQMAAISPRAGSLGAIVRSYKSAVTRWCRQNGFNDFGWQSRFYDHIIRADGSLNRIRAYIANNPAKWENDRNNPANLWM